MLLWNKALNPQKILLGQKGVELVGEQYQENMREELKWV